MEEDLNIKTKNSLLNHLRDSIETTYAYKGKYIKEMEKEPEDQYGMAAFKRLNWGGGTEGISDNTERSARFRRHTYTILSALDIDELKEFSDIIVTNKRVPLEDIFNAFSDLGGVIDIVSDHLYSKKDKLNKLDIADLKTLKNSFDKILSTVESVSVMSKQLILDYENNKDFIKTDTNELESYLMKLGNQFKEKADEAEKLQEFIMSTYSFNV
ncbi:blasticidin-S acetyltransferase (plasmid) [Borrelia maritima]|uniref:Blasticidin-S acetyltransferase n=1 Tax=Borrelia maritima TaxID=2761123 RepID=A0A5J6WD44_9SPIR|nr:blasticidin-S acetyltransferase [Borrelia maritima]